MHRSPMAGGQDDPEVAVKILVAEDDSTQRLLLEGCLTSWGHDVATCADGAEALYRLLVDRGAELAILDWMMPGLDGPTICGQVRQQAGATPPYLILATARDRREDLIAGLRAGADDYLVKPLDLDELQVRIEVGRRVLDLRGALAERVAELEAALANVRQLQGLLPICSYCKKIRDDENYWQKVETYISTRTNAQFSHGVCPECFDRFLEPQLAEARRAHQG